MQLYVGRSNYHHLLFHNLHFYALWEGGGGSFGVNKGDYKVMELKILSESRRF